MRIRRSRIRAIFSSSESRRALREERTSLGGTCLFRAKKFVEGKQCGQRRGLVKAVGPRWPRSGPRRRTARGARDGERQPARPAIDGTRERGPVVYDSQVMWRWHSGSSSSGLSQPQDVSSELVVEWRALTGIADRRPVRSGATAPWRRRIRAPSLAARRGLERRLQARADASAARRWPVNSARDRRHGVLTLPDRRTCVRQTRSLAVDAAH